MASKASESGETTEARDDAAEGALVDSMTTAVKKMLARAKERGYVTYDELNQVLPPDQVSSEQIEDVMAMLSEMGISAIENEEQEDSDSSEEGGESNSRAAGNLDEEDAAGADGEVACSERLGGLLRYYDRKAA